MELLYFGKWYFEAQPLKLKHIYSERIRYIFSKKAFLIFRENETLIFWEIKLLSAISKNEIKLPSKKFLYFKKWNLIALKLIFFFIFSQKQKNNFLAFQH